MQITDQEFAEYQALLAQRTARMQEAAQQQAQEEKAQKDEAERQAALGKIAGRYGNTMAHYHDRLDNIIKNNIDKK